MAESPFENYFDVDFQMEAVLAGEAAGETPKKKQKTTGGQLTSTDFYVDPDFYVHDEPEIDLEAETKQQVENGDEAAEAWDVQAIPLCLMGTKKRVDVITEEALKQFKKKVRQEAKSALDEFSLSEIVREEVKKQRSVQRNPTGSPNGNHTIEAILFALRHNIANVNKKLDRMFTNLKENRSTSLKEVHPVLLLFLEDLLFEDKPYIIIWKSNQFKAFTLRLKENKCANEREKKRFQHWKFELTGARGGKQSSRCPPSFKTTFPNSWKKALIEDVRAIRQTVRRMTGRN